MHWIGAGTSKNAVAVSHSAEVYTRYTLGTYRLIDSVQTHVCVVCLRKCRQVRSAIEPRGVRQGLRGRLPNAHATWVPTSAVRHHAVVLEAAGGSSRHVCTADKDDEGDAEKTRRWRG